MDKQKYEAPQCESIRLDAEALMLTAQSDGSYIQTYSYDEYKDEDYIFE